MRDVGGRTIQGSVSGGKYRGDVIQYLEFALATRETGLWDPVSGFFDLLMRRAARTVCIAIRRRVGLARASWSHFLGGAKRKREDDDLTQFESVRRQIKWIFNVHN